MDGALATYTGAWRGGFDDSELVDWARLRDLFQLAYNDPRFQRFGDGPYVSKILDTCADSKHRFDPFNWDGKVPPGHVR